MIPAGRRPARSRAWWWTVPAVLGLVLTVLIMVVLPPDRSIESLPEVLFKLSPLLLAVAAVAGFPRRPGLGAGLLVLVFVGYLGAVDTLDIMHVLDYSRAADKDAAFPALYRFTLFATSFTVLAVLFAYRLGGASTARVLKAGVAGVLVVVSGLNDLTFWAMYDWTGGRPRVLDWASHIAVFVGGPPTAPVAIAFCAVHLALAAAVLALPVQRWLDRVAR
ncbi:hypothetical protein Sru01_34510 [Sphaerisporangium rufum]|uniref:Uncharacterized protein n=1 Tax=Sphaerisporangium rufum TaxID=1381558 RepID=A0A919R2N1_9ACTN|nr:hypothetical protein [Sphaerisporangium rufum]GII78469.1 hypothetical protein Sru01_34510 [Sphaerisporangium rufum]